MRGKLTEAKRDNFIKGHDMFKYKLLVIDDDVSLRKQAYMDILGKSGLLSVEFVYGPEEINKIATLDVDGYIVDVVLDHWGLELKDVIGEIGDNKGPIILVSSKWLEWEDRKLMNLLNNMRGFPVKHFMSWKEFYDSSGAMINPEIAKTTEWKIINELDQFHQRSQFIPAEKEALNILHISDPQFGDRGTDEGAFLLEDAVSKYLRKARVEPHFLLITGDIAYSGRPYEYETALKWFESFLSALWPGQDMRERVLLVPGNHDMNLRFCAVDNYTYDFENNNLKRDEIVNNPGDHCRFGMAPFMEFAHRLTGDKRFLEYENNLCWVTDRFLHFGIRFYQLNSAGEIDAQNPNKSNVPKDALQRITKQQRCSTESGIPIFNIAVSHHGPSRGAEIKGYGNWQEVINFFEINNINMLIHGHGHGWRGYSLQEGKATYNMLCFMAPTTHLKSNKRAESERRGFNLITLKRCNHKVEKIFAQPYEMMGAEINERQVPRKEWDVLP